MACYPLTVVAVIPPPGSRTSAHEPQLAAFEAMVRDHEAMLRAFAHRLCQDPDEINDLLQDTFERALRALDRFQAGSNARAWLCTILHNTFIDRCRAPDRRARREPIEDLPIAAEEPAPEPAWASVSGQQLRAAIAQLEPDFRIVYELHALEHRSYQDIADRLGIAYNTVGTRLNRARRKLRGLLAEMIPGVDP